MVCVCGVLCVHVYRSHTSIKVCFSCCRGRQRMWDGMCVCGVRVCVYMLICVLCVYVCVCLYRFPVCGVCVWQSTWDHCVSVCL